ncbi:uncharacterized protein LOC144002047 [Festucalex cinctus]
MNAGISLGGSEGVQRRPMRPLPRLSARQAKWGDANWLRFPKLQLDPYGPSCGDSNTVTSQKRSVLSRQMTRSQMSITLVRPPNLDKMADNPLAEADEHSGVMFNGI